MTSGRLGNSICVLRVPGHTPLRNLEIKLLMSIKWFLWPLFTSEMLLTVYFTLFYFISWILGSGEKSRTRRPGNDSCCLIFCRFGFPKKKIMERKLYLRKRKVLALHPQPSNSDIWAFLSLILLQNPWFESVFHQKSFSVASFANTNTVFCHSICRILWARHATKNQRLKHCQTARM